jgi:hypothetical protein
MEAIQTTTIQEYKDIIAELCDNINEYKARKYEKFIPDYDGFVDEFYINSADGYECYLAGDAEKVITSLRGILKELQINSVTLGGNGNYLIEAVNRRGVIIYSQQWHDISHDAAHGIAMGLSLGFGSNIYVNYSRFNDFGKICWYNAVNTQPKNYFTPNYVYDGYFVIIDNCRAWTSNNTPLKPGYKFESKEEAEAAANDYRQQHPGELVEVLHSSQINNQMYISNLVLPSFNHYKNL